MRKAYYSIGIFIAVFFLSAGFYTNYQVSSLKDQVGVLNRTIDRMNAQKTDASGQFPRKDAMYTFETYDTSTGGMEQQQFQVVSYSSDHIVLRQSKEEEKNFLLKDTENTVTVYLEDGETVYEYTDIATDSLPEELQAEMKSGKTIPTVDELYSFLENYSS